MKRPVLSASELDAALSAMDGWAVNAKGTKIARSYRFANFNEAFGFMTRAALVAEKMDHHPEWSNVYRVVEVALTTHDSGGVTESDIDLARAMDRIAGRS